MDLSFTWIREKCIRIKLVILNPQYNFENIYIYIYVCVYVCVCVCIIYVIVKNLSRQMLNKRYSSYVSHPYLERIILRD